MTFGQAWLVATVFAGLLLPAGEARRILRPSDAPVVPPVASGRAALAAAVLTVMGLAFVSALAQAESWAAARSGPPPAQAPEGPAAPGIGGVGPYPAMLQAPPTPSRQAPGLPDPSSLRRSVEAEQIGALLCPEGTMHALASLDREAAALQQARRHAAERAVREAFAAMRARVPAFLDAYYSLSAEYLRTLNWLAGDAQRYLERQMSEALAMEDSAASIAPALTRLAEGVPRDLLRQRERLLDRCRILPSDGEAAQVVAMAPAALLDVPEALAGIPLETRLGAAGLGTMAGGIAGALAGKLVAKIAAKEVFALATEALAKLALGKAAGGLGGAAAGAAAGAAVGSIVPGFGTTIGAIAGGIAGGLAIGVATDWALLRLDEMISREAFEAEILSAIDEAERELLAAIGVLPDAAPRPQNP
ncbi:hypothetical protein ruthe_02714 [Rubellimicrobium thermophilum DSM 16684]|uniref:Uncharacterized protein n=1 Tax=Rubellimicrobium thermophilum DSM 16684 TaxID=1123069 RepID=S9QU39_9RHOB|nr:hypothetical protein [Rubellimicrobium thermophilum]EPX83097.1 hypothetical protein ruthe_02714 [Rubellimicrobium thermophilum DSM 16684]